MSLSVRSLSTLDQKNNNEYITPRGPWDDLDPNDFTQWWKKHHIVNPTKFIKKKNQDNIYAYFVIQDTTLSGICWHLSYWYYNDPNRYVNTIYNWIFDKELTNLIPNDIMTNDFTVYDCKYAEESQKKYCKIFIRR
jgi:hypothetical protein